MNQGTQMLLTNNQGQAVLFALPELNPASAPIALNGVCTATFAPDGMPNHLLFAMDQQSQFCIKVMSQGGEITHPNAHQAKITAFEFCQFNGQDIVFTAGLDMMLNAWTIDK